MKTNSKGVNRLTYGAGFVFLLVFLSVSAPSIIWAQSQNPFNIAIPQGAFLYSPVGGGGPQGKGTFGSSAEGFMPNSQESERLQGGISWHEEVAPSEPMEMSGQMGMQEQIGTSGPLEHWNR